MSPLEPIVVGARMLAFNGTGAADDMEIHLVCPPDIRMAPLRRRNDERADGRPWKETV
jgi:hypothetical protein